MPRPAALLACLLLTACAKVAAPLAAEPPPAPPEGATSRLPADDGSRWPTLLGPAGDGHVPGAVSIEPWPKAGPRKVFEVPLGTGYAPPTIWGSRLVHWDQQGDAARVSCRNADTGELVWTRDIPTAYQDAYGYDPGPRAAPVLDGERVYCYGVDGKLTALAFAAGEQLWQVDCSAKYRVHPNFFGVGSAPLVVDGKVVVAVGGSPPGARPTDLRQARPNGTALVAFDAKTGAEVWKSGDELASYSTPLLRTMAGVTTVLYFARGGLIGVNPADGMVRFRYPYRSKMLESVNAANPVVSGDEILLSECYENGSVLLKCDGKACAPVWSEAGKDRFDLALQSHWCTPLKLGELLIGCHGRNANDAELRSIDWKTGEVKWRERRTGRCTLVAVGAQVLSLSEQGELRLIRVSPEKYAEEARFEVPELSYPSWAPPVLGRGKVYLRGQSGAGGGKGQVLVAYELKLAAKAP